MRPTREEHADRLYLRGRLIFFPASSSHSEELAWDEYRKRPYLRRSFVGISATRLITKQFDRSHLLQRGQTGFSYSRSKESRCYKRVSLRVVFFDDMGTKKTWLPRLSTDVPSAMLAARKQAPSTSPVCAPLEVHDTGGLQALGLFQSPTLTCP